MKHLNWVKQTKIITAIALMICILVNIGSTNFGLWLVLLFYVAIRLYDEMIVPSDNVVGIIKGNDNMLIQNTTKESVEIKVE